MIVEGKAGRLIIIGSTTKDGETVAFNDFDEVEYMLIGNNKRKRQPIVVVRTIEEKLMRASRKNEKQIDRIIKELKMQCQL